MRNDLTCHFSPTAAKERSRPVSDKVLYQVADATVQQKETENSKSTDTRARGYILKLNLIRNSSQ
jgi:hypothetical protein